MDDIIGERRRRRFRGFTRDGGGEAGHDDDADADDRTVGNAFDKYTVPDRRTRGAAGRREDDRDTGEDED